MASLQFRAMNTDVQVIALGGPAAERALSTAAAVFAEHERALSRFDPASDLSALNRAAGAVIRVKPLLFRAVHAALEAAGATGGLFNPAVLDALEQAGYDRSFDEIKECGGRVATAPVAHPVGVGRVLADPARMMVRLPPGLRLDLGGIGKGLAVDATSEALRSLDGYLIDAGGDIRAGGHSPEGGPWLVGVQDPCSVEQDLAVLALHDGAVATSSVMRRRWRQGGEEHHHLIDPRTGASARTDVLAATVIAATAARAEVFAKAAVIAGAGAGLRLLESNGVAGMLVLERGEPRMTADMHSYLAA